MIKKKWEITLKKIILNMSENLRMDNVHEVCHLNKPSSQTFRIHFSGVHVILKIQNFKSTEKLLE
jgi:hypothetical protein